MPGALEFLNYFQPLAAMYIVSINPYQDLEKILIGRKIHHFFKKIYAVESSKETALEDIARTESILTQEMVFIGDSFSDYESACAAGVAFIGREGVLKIKDQDAPVLKDLNRIRQFLTQKLG